MSIWLGGILKSIGAQHYLFLVGSVLILDLKAKLPEFWEAMSRCCVISMQMISTNPGVLTLINQAPRVFTLKHFMHACMSQIHAEWNFRSVCLSPD